MPSKTIRLRRATPFVHEQINQPAMQEQLSYTFRGVGSYFKDKGSEKQGSGLTRVEEEILLPQILSLPINDVGFWKAVDRYYTDINTKIPYGENGRELEIGQEVENITPITIQPNGLVKRDFEGKKILIKQAVTEKNLPLNVDDYIRYRHALCHPDVGPSPLEAKGNTSIQYYFEDLAVVQENKLAQLKIEDDALANYARIKDEYEKVKMVVTLMRNYIKAKPRVPKPNIEKLSEGELRMYLKELALSQPARFSQHVNDDNISKRYFIDVLISEGLLVRNNNLIVNPDDNQPLGSSTTEVIQKLNDPKNSGLLASLKARLKDTKRQIVE